MRPINLTFTRDLLTFIDSSPTPYHAVAGAIAALTGHGFSVVDEREPWPTAPGRYVMARDGALVAWAGPVDPEQGFSIVGAHTDSPNLRIKPQPDYRSAGIAQLGVEVYGGVLLNSWLDRDLGLAGRVVTADGVRLVTIDRPILRIPQLAIHLDREINENGLKLNPQQHLAPMWGIESRADLRAVLAQELGIEDDAITAFDLMCFDLTPSAVVGLTEEFIAAPRIDNLLSCFVAIRTLIEVADAGSASMPVVALFDHEEVGSTSATGAVGPLLASVLERSALASGHGRDAYLQALANSIVVSADNAHATHPNYVERHEPRHHIALNGGPVIKINANARYATSPVTAAAFAAACDAADVPYQQFVNRTDLACGSTIGPATAAALGIPTVDVGAPQLAMHSIRETAGVADPGWLHAALVELISRR